MNNLHDVYYFLNKNTLFKKANSDYVNLDNYYYEWLTTPQF
jgi:hypothetical protein